MFLSPFKLQSAIHQLESELLLAYPTEAIYGLGCDPLSERAVSDLLALKQRSIKKGLILIAANFSQLEPYLAVDEKIFQRLQAPTQETITWLVPVQQWVPKWITGEHQMLAVRITNHPLSKALCEKFDAPIVSTSANPSHLKPARTALHVRRYFPASGNLKVLQGATGGNKKPSKIYNAITGEKLR
ncbi:MAG: Sua5/YciO/YrdC/YwlC family protein [Methylococcales bacterium]|nr:Sua5/YciO/YrdC/YwlC family protein [Methylococcales bacterium]